MLNASESLGKKLIVKSFWLYLFTFLIAPSGYIVRLFASRELSVGDLGILFSAIGFIGIFSIYHDLGLTESLNYFIPRYWLEKKYNQLTTAVVTNLMTQSITGILLGSLLWFTSDWLALHHFQSPNAGGVLRVLCIYFFVGNFFTTFSSLFSAFQDVLANKLVEFVRSWGIVAFTIYFWTTHGTVVNFATAWILGTITALFVIAAYFFGKYWAILRLGRIEITRNLLSEYFGYSFWILIGANAGVILGQIDQQMIVNLLSPEAAGYYANFLSLSTIFNVFLGPLLGFLFPLYSELIHRDSKESIHHLNRILFTYFPAFSFIVSGFLFALAAPLTLFLFGEKYALSAELLQHMAPFIVFNILIQITFSALAGFWQARGRVKILTVACIINALANYIGIVIVAQGNIETWLLAAVYAMVLGWIVMTVMSIRLLRKQIGAIPFDWKLPLANLGFVIVFWSLYSFFFPDIFPTTDGFAVAIFWKLMIIGIIYALSLLAFNTKSIILLIREMKNLGIVKKKTTDDGQ